MCSLFIHCVTGAEGIGGLRQINTCRQVPLLVKFEEKPTFRVWCLYRYLVHGWEFNSRSAVPDGSVQLSCIQRPVPLLVQVVTNLYTGHTDKKENQIFLVYKEIQSGAVAKSYIRKGFLIYEEMRKYFPIYEEAVSHFWLCNCSILNFLICEENLILFFISAGKVPNLCAIQV